VKESNRKAKRPQRPSMLEDLPKTEGDKSLLSSFDLHRRRGRGREGRGLEMAGDIVVQRQNGGNIFLIGTKVNTGKLNSEETFSKVRRFAFRGKK